MASSSFIERLQQTYATAQKPGQQHRILMGPQGNPDSYFGWREARAVQEPSPQITTVGERELTPERIRRGLCGESVFPNEEIIYEDPNFAAHTELRLPKPPAPEHAVFKSAQRETATRRIIRNKHDRGQRSPQNQGRHR